jgi:hypothetical protein
VLHGSRQITTQNAADVGDQHLVEDLQGDDHEATTSYWGNQEDALADLGPGSVP